MLPSRGRGCRLHGRRRCVGRCGERRGTATEGCVQLRHAHQLVAHVVARGALGHAEGEPQEEPEALRAEP